MCCKAGSAARRPRTATSRGGRDGAGAPISWARRWRRRPRWRGTSWTSATGPLHDRALCASHGQARDPAARQRGHRSDHPEAVPEARGTDRLRTGAVPRLAVPARRQPESGLRAQRSRDSGREPPPHLGELRLRLLARARGLGAARVRVPRHPGALLRRHFRRELLPERPRPRAPALAGNRRAVPAPSGGGRRVPAHRRPRGAARGRRARVPHRVHDGALPARDAAARARRDRKDAARRGSNPGVRKQPGRGTRAGGTGVKTYTIAVLPGDGIGPEVIAEAERALEAVAERFRLDVTLQRFPVGAAGVAAAGDPLPEATREAVTRADAVLLGAVGDPALDQSPRHLEPETGLLALRSEERR